MIPSRESTTPSREQPGSGDWPGLVVDASVAASWFLPDEADAFSEAILAATSHAEIWVPALWQLEICNLLRMAQRRRRISGAKRRELVEAASALRLRIDREPVVMADIDTLADRYDLTAYDAVYLELALRRSLQLATTDGALMAAMKRSGGQVFDLASIASSA
ncbi:MAG: type II toxin-antitoxin system VapC family toxin [Lautropia sp.]